MLTREDNSNILILGICGSPGFLDGASSKFCHPLAIDFDKVNPRHLLITDFFNLVTNNTSAWPEFLKKSLHHALRPFSPHTYK